ncbi:PRC-barrel domain-containing protein [Lignipirellula cremea]|uniref:PRC-barrel domain protein n=1 Tax=Lignipirellula cremea TaxID=2528010 RepID=A0A518DR32_9BACT|nr:PRC-barrel domain-containing protein [Lignipirellula cremea]QDU94274.1 PRC-barrel domain protein [Lignipirellula cremea]
MSISTWIRLHGFRSAAFAGLMLPVASGVALAEEKDPTANKPALELKAGEPRLALHIGSSERDFGPVTRATTLLGRHVMDTQGKLIGSVEDVAIDLEEGRGALLLLQIPGDKKGRRQVAAPWSAVSNSGEMLQLRVDRTLLEKAPSLQAGDTEKTQNRLWGAAVFEFFDVEPYWSDRTGASPWGPDSEFSKAFAAGERSKIQGEVKRINYLRPAPAATPSVQVVVATADGDKVAHMGPLSYLSRRNFTFNQGEKVTIDGVASKVGDAELFIASSVQGKMGSIDLRNAQGVGAWSDWSEAADQYQFALLTNLQGKVIVDADGKPVGEVVDLALLERDGRIAYAGARFEDKRDHLHAIPLSAFVASPGSETWRLEVDEKVIENTPTFAPEDWPTQIDRAWVEYVHVRYGKPLFGGAVSERDEELRKKEASK